MQPSGMPRRARAWESRVQRTSVPTRGSVTDVPAATPERKARRERAIGPQLSDEQRREAGCAPGNAAKRDALPGNGLGNHVSSGLDDRARGRGLKYADA